MALSDDDIVTKFLITVIPKLAVEPGYNNINKVIQSLYGNSFMLSTTIGGGSHGHIGLIMIPNLYMNIPPKTYIIPLDTVIDTNVSTNVTSASSQQFWNDHKEACCIFGNNTKMNNTIEAQVIDTVNDMNIVELQNSYTSYLRVTTRDIFNHISDCYRKSQL